jgi:hypothetical protein
MSRYYVLAERDDPTRPWFIAFGAYDREDVMGERDYRRDHFIKAKNLKVLTVATAKQTAIDAAINALNGRDAR